MPNQDDLNRRLADALDQSLERFDENTLATLAERRQRALTRKRRFTQSAWAAVAAAIFIAIALPVVYQSEPTDTAPPEQVAYYSVDPEMLEVMDMLMAWGELANEEPDAI